MMSVWWLVCVAQVAAEPAAAPDAGAAGVAAVAPVDGGAAPAEAAPESAGALKDDTPWDTSDAGVDATLASQEAPADDPAPGASHGRKDPHPAFVKGELSVYLGSDRLIVKNTRIGLSLGVDRFDQSFFIHAEPLLDLRFLDGKLGFGFGVPLRFEVFSYAFDFEKRELVGFGNAGKVRAKDWDSVHDFGRILKYVVFGKKEDNLYISAGQRYSVTIGHGGVMRRYAPNIDIDYPRASLEVDMYNDNVGFELSVNDVLEWNQLALIAFLKPFSFIKPDNLILKTLSVGVTGALDWKAPWALSLIDASVRELDSDGRLRATNRPVGLVGIDVEAKVVKTEQVDIKPYVDVSGLVTGDLGVTLGVLGRFNVGTKTVNAFRVVLEGRYLGSRYQPSYFDTFYEIDRFAYLAGGQRSISQPLVPKQRVLLETGLGSRGGYYVEASWGIPEAVGLTFALEGVTNAKRTNFVAHLEVPVLSFVQVFGSYYLRGIESFTELGYSADTGQVGVFGDKAVAFAGARVKVLPFLFLNGRLYKTFRMNPDIRSYDNQFGFWVDLELGYEFPLKKKDGKDTKEKADEKPAAQQTGLTPATDPGFSARGG